MTNRATEACWVDRCIDAPTSGQVLCEEHHSSCTVLDVKSMPRECEVSADGRWLTMANGPWVTKPGPQEHDFWAEVYLREAMDRLLVAGRARRVGTSPWGDAVYEHSWDDLEDALLDID